VKVYVFCYDRYTTATTPRMLENAGLEYTVLFHTQEQHDRHVEGGTVEPGRGVVTGERPGLAVNRNWVLENMMDDGEWCLQLVDDMVNVTGLTGDDYAGTTVPITVKNSTEWGRKMRRPVALPLFMERCEETRMTAERHGVRLAGFAAYNNPLFRRKKWARNVFTDGRAWIMQKCDMRLDEKSDPVDDYCWTAQNIEALTGTLVNQWTLPLFQRYTPGGLGTASERMALRLETNAYLVERFPGLLVYAKKKGVPEGGHVRIKPMTPERLAEYRIRQRRSGVVKATAR